MRILCVLLLLTLAIPSAIASPQSIGPVTINPTPIDLTAGSATLITCTATINDSDGSGNIVLVNATFWDSTASSENSTDDNAGHYSTSNCSVARHNTPSSSDYACSFSLYYYANPSDWICKMRSYDEILVEVSSQETVAVNQLTALELSSASLDFGTVALGSSSVSDINISVANMGNVAIDVNVSGTGFNCTSGGFGAGYARFSAGQGEDYGNMTSLSVASSTLAIDITQSDAIELSSKSIFWKISIPSSGAGGICTNTISLVAELMRR
jgi:hypothetical protein